MIRVPTLFIIGAGASVDAGLPTGVELRERIAQSTDISFDLGYQKSGDRLIGRAVHAHAARLGNIQHVNQYIRAGKRIKEGIYHSDSIDNFIENNKEDIHIEFLGKLSICREILRHEKDSPLNAKDRITGEIDLSGARNSWYEKLSRAITSDHNVHTVDQSLNNCSFIIFNYDRCIEHYIYNSIKKIFGINENIASGICSNMSIVHPYGSVGDLPWRNNSNAIHFGQEPNDQQLVELTSRIRTFSETLDTHITSSIQELVDQARRTFFLGFAYHPQNMRLIRSELENRNIDVLGTAKNISNYDHESIWVDIQRSLGLTIGHRATLENCDCSAFFDLFRRTITSE